MAADHPQMQAMLARVHDVPERPRCLCVAGGVEMYVARHRQYVLKRMPETGNDHHPGCSSYEPDLQDSGLGQLAGRAIVEKPSGQVELKVGFSWARSTSGRSGGRVTDVREEVAVSPIRMSLRAVTHYLFERAGLNRWSPAMAGKRNQGVLHKYLTGAAEGILVKGVALAERLYVPEPFNEAARKEIAQRRHHRLSVLQPHVDMHPLGLVIGEYKSDERVAGGQRLWVRHMPDTPLLTTGATWARLARLFAPLLEARDADTRHPVRLLLTALISARREHTSEVETASLMLASVDWIPLDGVFELPLIQALVENGRRFIKPLRYDAPADQSFANALLLDAGKTPAKLLVISPFMSPLERQAKEAAIARAVPGAWSWTTSESFPALPVRVPC